MPRITGQCGGCHTLVTFEVDENGSGTLPKHGHKLECPWGGKEIVTETQQMRDDRLRREREVWDKSIESARPFNRSNVDVAALAVAMALATPHGYCGAGIPTKLKRPQGHRRFPVPGRKY